MKNYSDRKEYFKAYRESHKDERDVFLEAQRQIASKK